MAGCCARASGAALFFVVVLGGCAQPQLRETASVSTTEPITVLKSTIYETTSWAVTDILPTGANTPFTGLPMPSMHGADSVAVILDDFVIPGLNQPVEVPIELIVLNERNIEPLKLGDDLFDFYFALNPAKRSLGKMTVIQTKPDDKGPGPDGIFLRETDLHLLAVLVPRSRGQIVVSEASIRIASPVPIPFSFDPAPDTVLVEGAVGDRKANWHKGRASGQRNFFIFEGLLQVPLGGQKLFDPDGAHTSRGGSVAALSFQDSIRDARGMPMHRPNVSMLNAVKGIPPFYDSTLVKERQSTDIALHYVSSTGEVKVSVPEGVRLSSINLTSTAGVFTGPEPRNLNGSLDRRSAINVFKLAIGSDFGELSFGRLARPGLAEDVLLKDISARVLLSDGRPLGRLRLVHTDQ